MTYDKVPLFIGLPNSGINSIGDGSGYMLPCNAVVAEHSVKSNPQKTLGKGSANSVARAKKFGTDNFMDCRLELEFFLLAENEMDNAYGFLFDEWTDGSLQRGNETGKNFFPVMFGGNVYEECYLTNYSLNIKPFQPVTCKATMKSFKPPKETTISGYTGTINEYYNSISNSNKFVYGHTCSLSGLEGEVVGDKLVLDLTYDKRYGANETSCIYDSQPKSYLVNAVDAELNIAATGFKMFLPYEGFSTTGDISVGLYNSNGSGIGQPSKPEGFELRLTKGSFVGEETLGVRGTDNILTRIQIKDSIL